MICSPQVVPASLWEVLDAMVVICTHRLTPLGSRVEVAALREAAQLSLRAALLHHAARVAAFTSGILTIHRCLQTSHSQEKPITVGMLPVQQAVIPSPVP